MGLDLRLGLGAEEALTLPKSRRAVVLKKLVKIEPESDFELINYLCDENEKKYERLLEIESQADRIKALASKTVLHDDFCEALAELLESQSDELFEGLDFEDRKVLFAAKDTEAILGIIDLEVDEEDQKRIVGALRRRGYKIPKISTADDETGIDVMWEVSSKIKAKDLVEVLVKLGLP